MTRAEIEHECLELPEAERAALAETLLRSLRDRERLDEIRQQLGAAEDREMEALRQKLDTELASWFVEPSVEMTDGAWDELLGRARTQNRLDEPFAESVPVEWVGRTPRDLLAALKAS